MSTSGLSTSVTPPVSLCVSISASAPAPGRRGPTNQAASTTVVRGDGDGGQGDRQRVAGLAEHASAAAGRSARAAAAAARKPAATSASVRRDAVAVGAEGGDEDEQHGAGHERLATGVGVEGERVRRQHDERRADRRQQRPAADVLDRGHGGLELVAHQAEVGEGDVPRLARREDGGERRRVGEPGDRPAERRRPSIATAAHTRDGQPAQHERQAVADDARPRRRRPRTPSRRRPGRSRGRRRTSRAARATVAATSRTSRSVGERRVIAPTPASCRRTGCAPCARR